MRNRFYNKSIRKIAIDNIPDELLQLIFQFACTDGGATGCSLSQVSKHFRALARTSRFHSIALRSGSSTQVMKFTSCFVAERQHAGTASSLVKVRHLFLASARRVKSPGQLGAWDEFQRYRGDVLTLMKLIAPDLYSLLLLSNHLGRDELLFPDIGWLRYDELRELSLYGNAAKFGTLPIAQEPLKNSQGGTVDLADCTLRLPKLTHLHITCSFQYFNYTSTSDSDFGQWPTCAPGLTHLCLSNWKLFRPFVTSTAAYVIGHSDEPSLLDRLEVFILSGDAHPLPPTLAPSSEADIPPEFFATIEELLDMHRCSSRRWALVPPRTSPLESEREYVQAAQEEWARWEAGLPGCWTVDESYYNKP